MRQRVLIAIGLACRPELLIADEPTSALDVTVQRRILDQLAELTREMGTSVLFITHDLSLAAERAARVIVMRHGEIMENGTSHELFAAPKNAYTRELLAASPSLISTLRKPRAVDAAADAKPVVTVEGLTKTFRIRARGGGENTFTAVDDVSFTIPRASTVAIVGESGSGKSTTANLVLGLETPTSGRILFGDTDLATLDRKGLFAFRRRVQPVFQNPFASLDPRFSVERSIAEPMVVHGLTDARRRRSRVAELLDKVSLPSALGDRFPHELSGGQRQRVAIARALALTPEVIVLDEAVSALDVLVQAQVLDLLADLQDELGLSYLFISHDLAVVRMISHEVHVMQNGRVVESGTPAQIFDAPQQEYTRELLAAIPHFAPDRAEPVAG
jgi:peptide/nickel transport system ATP-binding protein